MNIESHSVRICGQNVSVPMVRIQNCAVIVTGGWLKTAQLFDEELLEETERPDPPALIKELRNSQLQADIFTFSSRAGDADLRYDFPLEWDNLAVLSTIPFENWWNSLPTSPRRDVRRAAKRGVIVKAVPFDDALVCGIKRIYDETPVRQGRRFWHYGKDFGSVREINATYLERSQFVGAFLNDELIGFIKYVRVDNTAMLMQVLAMEAHRHKLPTNALLKHTIELCEQQGLSTLTYGKFAYGNNYNSSLSEFKKRNGFTELRFRRYYVPLTLKGRVVVSIGLHRGVWNMLPVPLADCLRKMRARALPIAQRGVRSTTT